MTPLNSHGPPTLNCGVQKNFPLGRMESERNVLPQSGESPCGRYTTFSRP
jgi:hypothetical protein